ncbi:hypothetical protein OY671_011520 [Metschnikowia pulcherrima]|nr:hypothetical protein OY671_011520 [Metschnikowia pulcherrima]
MQTPQYIESSLQSSWLWFIARSCSAVVFIASGAAKSIDFPGGVAEMRGAGSEPARSFNIAVAASMSAGSISISADRAVWSAAAASAVFSASTIFIVHAFWRSPEPQAKSASFFASEHVSVSGGSFAAAIASHYRASAAA